MPMSGLVGIFKLNVRCLAGMDSMFGRPVAEVVFDHIGRLTTGPGKLLRTRPLSFPSPPIELDASKGFVIGEPEKLVNVGKSRDSSSSSAEFMSQLSLKS